MVSFRKHSSVLKFSTSCLEQSRTWFFWGTTIGTVVTNCLDNWLLGILTERAILRIPLKNKKTKRLERESSFLLSASLDTQGDWIGVLVLGAQQFTAQGKKKGGDLSQMRTPVDYFCPLKPVVRRGMEAPRVGSLIKSLELLLSGGLIQHELERPRLRQGRRGTPIVTRRGNSIVISDFWDEWFCISLKNGNWTPKKMCWRSCNKTMPWRSMRVAQPKNTTKYFLKTAKVKKKKRVDTLPPVWLWAAEKP